MTKQKTSKKNKRAVSEMVAYVLLIVITMALAVGMYAFLMFLTRGVNEIPKCPETLSLAIQDYSCLGSKEIQVTIKNKGLFNIDGISVKGTDDKSQEAWFKLIDDSKVGNVEVGEAYVFLNRLKSNNISSFKFSFNGLDRLEKIAIEPVKIKEEEVIFCDDAAITQELNCS